MHYSRRVASSRRITDPNIFIVYACIFLLGIAYGVAIALLPLELTRRQFSDQAMGILTSVFAAGIVTLSLPMGAILRKVSPKHTLLFALFGYALTLAVFPSLRAPVPVGLSRFADGAFSVAIWVSCETILLERANQEHRAFITSLYAMSMAIGYVLGPLLAKGLVAVAPSAIAFYVAAALAVLSGLIATRLDAIAPHALDESKTTSEQGALSAWALLHKTKTSCFGTFAYGYFQASVVVFLPRFLIRDRNIPEENTLLVTAFFALGMLLFTNPAGRLGDRYGHLLLMRVLACVGTLMIGSFIYLPSFTLMCAAVFVAGASLASISPVSLALQGAVTAERDLGRANAIYNAFYALGMLIGPPITSVIFTAKGGEAMLLHFVLMWSGFVVFTWVFAADDPRHKRAAVRAPREA